jgi:hypothetical protein
MRTHPRDNRSGTTAAAHAWRIAIVLLAVLVLAGCEASQGVDEPDIPLPGFGDSGPAKPTGVYAVIRRADVPLDASTDDAWSIVNEQVVPPVSRGIWRGNGLRVGLLQRSALDAYSEAMPQPVGFSRTLINRSAFAVPIVETARLRGDLRFQMDLTRPPKPRDVEMVQGGDNSRLRLLARIETQPDGQHTLILTPQHHIPSPLNLIPRDPLEKEMDGRVFDEIALRVTLGKDQIAVVGLHWPWPMGEVMEEDDDSEPSAADRVSLQTSIALPPADASDPAAPPAHLLRVDEDEDPPGDDEPSDARNSELDGIDDVSPQPKRQRIAPPLATSFGSTLLTGTRIRQPVRTVLLITIEEPEPDVPALPDE